MLSCGLAALLAPIHTDIVNYNTKAHVKLFLVFAPRKKGGFKVGGQNAGKICSRTRIGENAYDSDQLDTQAKFCRVKLISKPRRIFAVSSTGMNVTRTTELRCKSAPGLQISRGLP